MREGKRERGKEASRLSIVAMVDQMNETFTNKMRVFQKISIHVHLARNKMC